MGKRSFRDLGLEKVWRLRVEGQRRSGLSVRGFCRREGITETSFYYWRRAIKTRDAGAGSGSGSASKARFVALTVRREACKESLAASQTAEVLSASDRRVEILLPNRYGLRADAGLDGRLLERLLSLLEGRPC